MFEKSILIDGSNHVDSQMSVLCPFGLIFINFVVHVCVSIDSHYIGTIKIEVVHVFHVSFRWCAIIRQSQFCDLVMVIYII